jgi:hypothetical protein
LRRTLDRHEHAARFVAHEVDGVMEEAVRVDVDGLDTLVLDHDRQPPLGLLPMYAVKHSATAECDARGARSFKEASACRHFRFLPREIYLADPAFRRFSGHDCSPSSLFDQAAFGYGEDAPTDRNRRCGTLRRLPSRAIGINHQSKEHPRRYP